MILDNVYIIGNNEPVNIRVGNGRIAEISHTAFTGNAGPLLLTFNNAVIFPGLINSHDHLEFNLFPQLGNKTYNNYTEWGKHIHTHYKDEIAAVLKIPTLLRSEWGVYKNLLCGVTTVINHGERLGLKNELITVFEGTQCLHSVHFEKYWKLKLNNPLKVNVPVNIHVGEGGDWLSFKEINKLINYNLLKRKLVGIHAVSMSAEQAEKFEAIVWCPESNYFLLNRTAQIDLLEQQTNILFGTDSTLTGSWDVWEHLRLARKTGMLNDEKLYNSLNQNPANTWQLNSGSIEEGKDADLVVAKQRPGKNGYDAFFALHPADLLLVMHKGEIRLFDESLLPQLQHVDLADFSRIFIQDTCKHVKGDLPALIKKIREYYPEVSFPVAILDKDLPVDKIKFTSTDIDTF
jgi:cytosine/adenosine deaminase-related metal-dependent hydrolase